MQDSVTSQFYAWKYYQTHQAFLLPCVCGCDTIPLIRIENHGRGSMGAEPDVVMVYCTECHTTKGSTWDDTGNHQDALTKAADGWNSYVEVFWEKYQLKED